VSRTIRTATSRPPFSEIDFAPPLVERRDLAGGGFVLTSPVRLGEVAPSLGHILIGQARRIPERAFLVERDSAGAWRTLTFGEAQARARALAQALIDRDLGPERPAMILSGNGIDHALLTFAGYFAGVPTVPVSVAYSLVSRDHDKLKHIFKAVSPGLVYAANGRAFADALDALPLDGAEIVVGTEPPDGLAATQLADLEVTAPTDAVDEAFDRVGPDTVAKVLFTSGSTGQPKGVINTHRMLCSNQTMVAQTWRFVTRGQLTLLDWLPWNHTFGGNYCLNLVLANGGTMYIDGGKPAPGLIEQTVANLREVSPTVYNNVPAGYAMLLPYLEGDPALAQKFFAELKLIFYAGAGLSQDLWDRLEALAIRHTGRRLPMVSSWGSTETAPLAAAGHLLIERAGVIGLPPPGVELKFVPAGDKLEIRVRGPNVFPGYWRAPDLTRAAFDQEGFYRIGDAARLADPDDPSKGIVFDGRVAEDFKLATGTWVHVGSLRVEVLAAAAPALHDAVICGHDRGYAALLAWPSPAGLEAICGDLEPSRALASRELRDHIASRVAAHNARVKGSSMRIGRVLLMTEPPSIDANEITDKGYINQAAVLKRRAVLVERLYRDPPDDQVIVVASSGRVVS